MSVIILYCGLIEIISQLYLCAGPHFTTNLHRRSNPGEGGAGGAAAPPVICGLRNTELGHGATLI